MSEIVLDYRANPGALGSSIAAIYFNMSGVLCYVLNDGVEHPIPAALAAALTAGRIPRAGAGGLLTDDANSPTCDSSGNVILLGTLTPHTTKGIVGTVTNDDAQAGSVGEYIESVVAVQNLPTSTEWGDVTSISLSAGDWDVSALGYGTLNGATMTNGIEVGISTTTGNSATGLVEGSNRMAMAPPATSQPSSVSVSNYRMSLASTTTVYFKMMGTYSAGTPQVAGRLSARRVR